MASFQKALARLMDERQKPDAEAPTAAAAAVHDELGRRIAADETAVAAAFADLLSANSNGALDAMTPEAIAALSASAFRLLRDKRDQPFLLRAYQPSLEEHGWTTPHTVVEAVLDDQPHIVDTLCEALQAAGGEIEVLLNPLIDVERDETGALRSVGTPKGGRRAEQLFHAQITHLEPSPALEESLHHHLQQLNRVGRDAKAMRERLSQLVAELERRPPEGADAAAFLRWLGQGNFALLGYDEASLGNEHALGILPGEAIAFTALAGDQISPLALVRSATRSPVQRLACLDEVRIRRLAAPECRFVGLLTANAYRQSATDIPSLRRRFEQILAALSATDAFEPNVVGAMFDRLPVEVIAASTTEQLLELIRAQHQAELGSDLHVHRHLDRFGRNVLFTLFVPRRRFSSDSVARCRGLLESEVGPVLGSHVVHDDRPTVRIHLITAAPSTAAPALAEIANRMQVALDQRPEVPRSAGQAPLGAAAAGVAVGEGSRAVNAPAAVLRHGGAAGTAEPGSIEILPGGRGRFFVRVTAAADSLVLGDFLPLLQNLGLLVLRQDSRERSAEVGEHVFTVEASRGAIDGLDDLKPLLVETLRAVRAGHTSDDALSSLTLRARLPWRAINLVRTYVEYAAQLDRAPRDLAVRALTEHIDCTTALVELFATKFDARLPIANAAQRKRETASVAARLAHACEQVPNAEHRDTLRTIASLVEATVRSNAYLPEVREAVAPVVAIKIDPRALGGGGTAACRSETFVHAPAYDALILRAGAVANVELTLAHRRDQLRALAMTGLHARSLRSFADVALAGSGALFLHDGPSDAARAVRELAAVLLSVTDNVVGDNVVPPRDLVAYDEIDPYLVLLPAAIDPSLCGVVEQVAVERGYWLENAFAVGGSDGVGARRRAVGTAGAWECTRQHYRDEGQEAGREHIDTIGVGAPAELRLTPTVRLRAAFDRHHIVLDPDPDPRDGFEERQRLAHEVEASWSDYNPRRLSRGGAILPRAGRQIQLSPEARALLELGEEDSRFSGEEIVCAILRSRADLLWCAAPGASIRLPREMPLHRFAMAEGEAARVSVAEVRVRTVIECGATALTPGARVAFDVAGGSLYGPLVDGAAAAALADREATLEIALRGARARRPIEAAERDQIASQAAREIGEDLAQGCRRLALALSIERQRSATRLAEYGELIETLEEEGLIDCGRDALPAREEARARPSRRAGLSQPELATLTAATKLRLRTAILDSSLCEDLRLQPWIEEHFPAVARQELHAGIETHPLRHEIAALEVSRRLVDAMGATFVDRACRFTGKGAAEVAKAWTATYLIGRGEELFAELARERDGVRATDEVAAHLAVAESLERATFELLHTQASEMSLSKLVDRLSTAAAELLQNWPDRLAPARRHTYDRRADLFTAAGYSTDTADSIVRIASLPEVFQICDVAIRANAPRGLVCEAFLAVDRLFDMTWLEQALGRNAGAAPWEDAASHALRRDLAVIRCEIARGLLDARATGASLEEMVGEYSNRHHAAIERARQRITALSSHPQPSLAGLVVVTHELARLAAR